jgi:flagellar protein FlgJ
MKPVAIDSVKAAAPQAVQAPPDPQKVKLAREFEQIFVRKMLSSLEKTSKVSGRDNLDSGGNVYGSMVVNALADAVTAGGGIGLADMIARSMSQQHPAAPAKAASPGTPTSAPASPTAPASPPGIPYAGGAKASIPLAAMENAFIAIPKSTGAGIAFTPPPFKSAAPTAVPISTRLPQPSTAQPPEAVPSGSVPDPPKSPNLVPKSNSGVTPVKKLSAGG